MSVAAYRREMGLPPKPGDDPHPAPAVRAPAQHPEQDLHVACVQWLGYSLRPGVLVHSSPNGGSRNVVEAKKLKAMGCRAGWPDLELVWSEDDHVAVKSDRTGAIFIPPILVSITRSRIAFIELKAPAGSLSPAQREMQKWCSDHGVLHAVCRSLDDLAAVVARWGLTKGAK